MIISHVSDLLDAIWLYDDETQMKDILQCCDDQPWLFQQSDQTKAMKECQIRPATPIQLALAILSYKVFKALVKSMNNWAMVDAQIENWFTQSTRYALSPYATFSHAKKLPSFVSVVSEGERSKKLSDNHYEIKTLAARLGMFRKWVDYSMDDAEMYTSDDDQEINDYALTKSP